MQARRSLSLFVFSLGVGLVNLAFANPEYRITVVAPAGSTAADINNNGVVVGNFPASAASIHAFLNRGRGLVDLGVLGGARSSAVSLNDKGQVLGNWTNKSGQQRGFIYYRGAIRDIGTIPGLKTTFTDINYPGYITAYGVDPAYEHGERAFLRAPDGSYRDIGSLPYDNPMTYAYSLNNCNQITGASGPLLFPDQPLRAFVWSKGVMRDLGDFGWSPNSGIAINNCGQITGSASVLLGFRDRHAFIYSNGRLQDLEAKPRTEFLSSEGAAINSRGYIVGASAALSGFIYRGRRMESLNALIDPKLHWDIRDPRGINDAGQIAATAYKNDVSYAVRLDLIRPLTEAAPPLQLGEDSNAPELAPAALEAQAREDVKAQAREIVRPVAQ